MLGLRDRLRAAALLAATLGLVAGCGGGSSGGADRLVTAVIGASGGTLTSADGRLTLIVPEGALPAENTLSIRRLRGSQVPGELDAGDAGPDAAYDLGPDGMTFQEPVTVRFDLGADPRRDDGSLAFPLALLLTSEGGRAAPLAELRQETDPQTGLTRVHGELEHFSPLVVYERAGFVARPNPITGVPESRPDPNLPDTLVVVNGLPPTAPVGEPFTLQVVAAPDLEGSPVDAVGEAVYVHLHARRLSNPRPARRPLDIAAGGSAFVGTVDYACREPGAASLMSGIELNAITLEPNGLAVDTIERYAVFLSGRLRCLEPDTGDGGDEMASIEPVFTEPLPGAGPPGPPTDLPGFMPRSPRLADGFAFFGDADGARPAVAVATADGMVRGYDASLEPLGAFSLGGDYRLAAAALRHSGADGSGEPRDAMIFGGVAGALLVQERNGVRETTALGEFGVTDITPFDAHGGDGVADSAAVVDFDFVNGKVLFVAPRDDGFALDLELSGVMSNSAVADNTIVATHVGEGGWDDPGETALVLTVSDVAADAATARLWRCRHVAGMAGPSAACSILTEVRPDAVRVGCAPPDAAGETVCAVSSLQAGTLEIFGGNSHSGFPALQRLATIEEAGAINAAVTRDGTNVRIITGDRANNAIITVDVTPDGSVSEERLPAPAGCRNPINFAAADGAASGRILLGTCEGEGTVPPALILDEETLRRGFQP